MSTRKWSEVKRERVLNGIYDILAHQSAGVPIIDVAEKVLTYLEKREEERIKARKDIEDALA